MMLALAATGATPAVLGTAAALGAIGYVLWPLLRGGAAAPTRAYDASPAGPLMELPMDEAEALIAKARAAQRVCPDCGPCPEPNAKFCSNCGKSLPDICRHCGAALAKPDARFCSECGASQGTVG